MVPFHAQGVCTFLTKEEGGNLIVLLKEYKDCFAWSFEDMKGMPPEVVQHTIPIWDDMKLVKQRPYDMNPKYEINFIGPISPAANSSQAMYIIVATDYFTKWVKARATCKMPSQLPNFYTSKWYPVMDVP